ncbi:MAG: YerC/YecD family TrpR-related protein [Anaerovoracaceae bacterium]|jgi:TrpR-related protein YerC/YecD
MAFETKLKSEETDELFKAMLTLDNLEDCYRFFEDLCTVKEIHAMAQRFEVAKLLIEHKTYSEIESETGASTATISRINRTLQYGADGYTRVIQAQKENESSGV